MLSAQRDYSDGYAHPIKFSEMEAYVRIFGLESVADRSIIVDVVIALDNVFIKAKAAEARKRQSTADRKEGRITGVGNG